MAAPSTQRREERRRWINPLLNVVVVVGLLAAVYLLPADTSLAELYKRGVLRACVPSDNPPLVTNNPDRPGFDIELLGLVARELEVTLALNINSTMGRDINPRNWRINRAQCQIVAGGVLVTPTTRSYLDTSSPYLEAGWAVIVGDPAVTSLDAAKVGFFASFAGSDRIALSRFLRGAGADIDIMNSPAELAGGLQSGAVQLGVTQSLSAYSIAAAGDWPIQWLSSELGHYPVAFGLWKGDLTLKRAFEDAMQKLQASGEMQALVERYEITPIETTFGETAAAS